MNITTQQRTLLISVIAGVVIVLGAIGWRHFHAAHSHGHDGAAALSLDNGQRWKTDAPQRAGMQQIRDAAASVQIAVARNQLTAEQAKAFSETVNVRFGEMVKACKLAPQADATFHVIMTDLMRGAALLAGNPKSAEGMAAVVAALRQYAEYFDHAGWAPLPETGA